MMEKEELYARIEELERKLAEERIRRKITEDNSDCALWEYEIATKKYVLSRKLGRKRIQKSRNRTLPEWRQRKAFR